MVVSPYVLSYVCGRDEWSARRDTRTVTHNTHPERTVGPGRSVSHLSRRTPVCMYGSVPLLGTSSLPTLVSRQSGGTPLRILDHLGQEMTS